MSEGYLSNVTREMITQLGSLAHQEVKLLFGVEDELEKLKNSIIELRAKLLGAEDQQAKNQDIKNLLIRIKDVVYDADDLIDEFSCQDFRKPMNERVCYFFSMSKNPLSFRLQMAHKIKKISEVIDKFNVEIGKFNIIEHIRDVRDQEIRERETHSFILEEQVIGRDHEKNFIMAKLFDSNVKENVSIIAIVGLGGLGKTTLAQYLYNNSEVTNHFELKMWVCVSQEFDVKIVVGKIIESATKKKLDKMQELDLLQSRMRREIEGKKYLLVMDDVWNEDDEKWMKLVELLMGGARGSKIVITTRSTRVAEIVRSISVFLIEKLSEDNSWLLFEKMTFGIHREGDEAKDPKLIEIGKEIVKKLNGVPLAIRTIGRVLSYKITISEWILFRDYELSTITQGENDIMSALKISYNNLPTHLKQCFTYCSLFPKGFLISKNELIKLWIAQGFINPSQCQGKSMEDAGHDYFIELYWRSFFQNMQRDKWGDIQEFKMHHLIHDLAQLVSGGEHILVRGTKAKNISIKQTRHGSVDFDSLFDWQLPPSVLDAKKLRSLLFPTQKSFASRSLNKQVFGMTISHFAQLRALDLRCLWIDAVPSSIDKLKHLRYLDLSENLFIKSLPNSITKLRCLQTLDLTNCASLRKLPTDTSDLVNLRYLGIDGCNNMSHMPKRLSRLTSLQTMNLFVLGKQHGCGLAELNKLNNLRGNLAIRGLELLRCNKENANASKYAELKEKQGLQKIELFWSSLETDEGPVDKTVLDNLQPHPNIKILGIRGYSGVVLSNWINSLSNLIEISINNCERLEHLPHFYQLPLLQSLCLKGLTCLKYIDNSTSSVKTMYFPSLQTLSLEDLPELINWCVKDFNGESISFPRLSNLHLHSCHKLSSFPLHPPLETLELELTTPEILELIMATTSSFDTPRLNRLVLSKIYKLDVISDGVLSNLISLNDLRISRCCDLQMSLSQVVHHLPALKSLYIEDCSSLDIFNDENESMQWKSLGSLRYLSLQTLKKLVSLPDGLQYVTTLQILELSDCENLTALPEWIGNLTSLSVLKITYCKNLKSLPHGIHCLASLQELKIYGCHRDLEKDMKATNCKEMTSDS